MVGENTWDPPSPFFKKKKVYVLFIYFTLKKRKTNKQTKPTKPQKTPKTPKPNQPNNKTKPKLKKPFSGFFTTHLRHVVSVMSSVNITATIWCDAFNWDYQNKSCLWLHRSQVVQSAALYDGVSIGCSD